MNKLWSILFFTAALVATWNMMNSSPAIGAETHSGIQAELSQLILKSVQAKKPSAKDLRITRMWTETLDEHKVRAVFGYVFSETGEGTEVLLQNIEGEAILHREPSDDSRLDKWVLQHVRTTGDSVDFSEGVVVTPVLGTDEADPAVTEKATN